MKKIFAFVLVMAMVAILFTACSATPTQSQQTTDIKINLYAVPGYTNLFYMSQNGSKTGTVYYHCTSVGGYSSMAPYIINGHFCEYVDGDIVEVIPTVRIEDTTN